MAQHFQERTKLGNGRISAALTCGWLTSRSGRGSASSNNNNNTISNMEDNQVMLTLKFITSSTRWVHCTSSAGEQGWHNKQAPLTDQAKSDNSPVFSTSAVTFTQLSLPTVSHRTQHTNLLYNPCCHLKRSKPALLPL